ncbi:nucleoside transporter-domain-containing protein [Rhodocollybia butyracea]|uniref:Nucleoside transporter-domain-containing protein n=1 Tax=Rhodocollybia butyracea TaxID=206335 RepID=A0A9P5Q7G8_9AGAR|nr:nucleoside transporter-domain-containing protein [Rhodocollybia butyracea]
MSPSSPAALYHAIPQVPAASNSIIGQPDIDLDHEEIEPVAVLPSVDTRIRWIHFVLGCAVLLPWNALITAIPYFLSRLDGSSVQSTFTSYLSITFTAANFLFLAHATATAKQMIPSRQTMISLLGLAALNFLLTLSTLITLSPSIFFAFVLLNGIVQAAFGSYLQNSVIAVASLFGPAAVQPMLSGQAAVAVVVSAVQVLSALISVDNSSKSIDGIRISNRSRDAEASSAFIFFGLSTIFLLFSAAAQRWLVSMPAYYAVAGTLEAGKTRSELGTDDEQRALVSSGPSQAFSEKQRILRVAKTNALFEIAVAYVFLVTLTVFPPITASVQSVNPNIHPLLFTSIHFLVFGLGDLFGRYICSFQQLLIWSAKRLLVLSLSRTLFIGLFLLCNIQRPASSPIPAAPIINSDFLFMLILFAFGLSNGYVSSMCMMSAPSLEHNPRLKGQREDVDVAATVSQFCLIGGLVLGSIVSFIVRGAVCACNPFTS